MELVREIQQVKVRAPESELAWLRDYLTFTEGSGRFHKRVTYLSSRKGVGAFPAGLFPLVLVAARKRGIPLTVEDARERPEGTPTLLPAFQGDGLRYYQREAWEALFRAQAAIVELPTASGKTRLAAALMTALPVPAIYLVGDAVLAEQTAGTIEELTGLAVGRTLGSGERLVCVTFQAVMAALTRRKVAVPNREKRQPEPEPVWKARVKATTRFLARFSMVVVDEAHMVPAAGFSDVMKRLACYWRFALSATPFDRGDRKSVALAALLGPRCYKKTARDLADEGFIASTDIRLIRYEHPTNITGDYAEARDRHIVRNPRRNALICEIVDEAPKPCLVLVEETAHGRILARRIAARWPASRFIDGAAPKSEKLSVIKALNTGALEVVISTRIFNVGVDIPEARTVIFARGGKATIGLVQGIGRVLRLAPGKRVGRVYDVFDWTQAPMKAHGTWFAQHAKKRVKIYLEQGHDVRVGDSPTTRTWQIMRGNRGDRKK